MKTFQHLRHIFALPLLGLLLGVTACSDGNVIDDEPTPDTTYALSITASDGGNASVVANEYRAGDEVTVTATPDDGYYFTAWQEDGASVSENPVYTFQMPARDLSLLAVFTEIPEDPITSDYPVAAGGHFTIMVNDGGGLLAFGFNEHGQLGDGTTENRTTPITIMPQTQFANVFCGASSAYAIDRDGNLYAWGNNENGRLGDGSTTDRHVPVQILSGTRFTAVAAGSEHTLALDAEGGLWAFGANDHGQLGDGSTTGRTSPIQVMSGSRFNRIYAGGYYSLAIDTDNRLWAFGWNNHGQLGDGTTTEQRTPVQVLGEQRFSRIAAGNYHTLAIDYNGRLWGFGMNMQGQLGDTDRADKLSPAQILSDRTFTEVAVRGSHSLALDAEGNLWGFGANSYGQLGDGTNTGKTSPVQVGAGRRFAHIFSGWYHTAAADAAGNSWLWGANQYGELGDGTTTNRNTPMQFGNGGDNPGGEDGSRILVVYYSWGGNSRSLAADIAQTLGCERVEVELTTPYTATSDSELYPIAQAEIAAIDNNGVYPSISTSVADIANYDAIVVVYPLWYSRMATPMQSFLHNHGSRLAGKTVAPVCTSASSGISQTVADARRLCPGATVTEALWVRSSNVSSSHTAIAAWLENIGLLSENS